MDGTKTALVISEPYPLLLFKKKGITNVSPLGSTCTLMVAVFAVMATVATSTLIKSLLVSIITNPIWSLTLCVGLAG